MTRFLLLFTLLAFSCKKNTPTGTTLVIPQKNEFQEKLDTQNLTSNPDFVFTQKRKTEIDFDETNETINNFDTFLKNSNFRTLEVESIQSNLQNGNLKCYSIGNDSKRTLVIDKSFSQDGTKASAEFMIGEEGFVDYKFQCEIFNDSVAPIFTKQIIFHRDLILNSKKTLGALQLLTNNFSNKVDHLIITNQGILKILDQQVLINAKKLVSATGAQIITFDSEANASNNINGLNGGSISIFSEKALGKLELNLSGQNAGKVTKIPDAPTNYPEYYNPVSLEGNKAILKRVDSGLECKSGSESCKFKTVIVSPPTNGLKGLRGVKGNKGYDGLNGGNTGFAKIYIQLDSTFEMDVVANVGRKSLGGQGSSGGPGTPGGRNFCDEHSIVSQYCRDYNIQPGANGDIGEQGLTGNHGYDGQKIQSSYINQENVSLNRIF